MELYDFHLLMNHINKYASLYNTSFKFPSQLYAIRVLMPLPGNMGDKYVLQLNFTACMVEKFWCSTNKCYNYNLSSAASLYR